MGAGKPFSGFASGSFGGKRSDRLASSRRLQIEGNGGVQYECVPSVAAGAADFFGRPLSRTLVEK